MGENGLKKARIYFIISAIIQIILAVNIIFNIDIMLDETIDAVEYYPEQMQEQMIDNIEKTGKAVMYVMTGIGIIMNALIIFFAVRKTLPKHKIFLIVSSIYGLFLPQSMIGMILYIVSLVLACCIKHEKAEKKPIPEIEFEKPTKKDIIISILLLVAYFSQFVLAKLVDINDMTTILIFEGITDLIIVTLCIFAFRKTLKKHIELFKNNFKTYIKYMLPRIGIMYALFFGFSIILYFVLGLEQSQNQQTLEQLPIWFLIPFAVITGPVIEEILFRGCIRRFIKNGNLFIVISAVLFGLLHTFQEETLQLVILLAIPYTIMGVYLAYIYKKTNNICTNIFSHMFINAIAVVIISLAKILG